MSYFGELLKEIYYSSKAEITSLNKNKVNPSLLVVYTAIFGNKDQLQDVPLKFRDVLFVCFSDKKQKAKGWHYVLNPDSISKISDPRLKSRHFKILPHNYFKKYKYSLWLDGSHMIRIHPGIFCQKYLVNQNEEWACFRHHQRSCVKSEIISVIDSKKDNKNNVNRIKKYLLDTNFKDTFGLFESGVILRKHNKKSVIKANNLWNNLVQNICKRDQLSLMYCLNKYNVNYRFIEGNIYNNYMFRYKHHFDNKALIIIRPSFRQLISAINMQINYKVYFSLFIYLFRGIIENTIYVILYNKEVIGLIIWNNKTIKSIVIKKDKRKKGLGIMLINKTKPNKDILIVNTAKKNQGFYEKAGFEVENLTMVRQEKNIGEKK